MKDGLGLTHKEAEVSLQQFGSNTITRKARKSFLKQYIASFGDPIIRILLIALAVNVLFMFKEANWYESAGIAVAVLLATLISTLSEYGSESAFEKLQEDAANVKCRVRRDGEIIELPVNDVVVGDIVLIQAGERIPADGRLISGELYADQSTLNGETKEALKHPKERTGPKQGKDEGFLAGDRLFRGSVICSGEGVMRVDCVGDNTFYGKLAVEIQEETIDSPLKTRLARLAKTISYFGYIAAAIVVLANLFYHIILANHFDPALISLFLADKPALPHVFLQAITLGITVIVMAVPEGLPMMITVVLSANMRRMLKDNVLVRKLVGIETAGSLNILFTDKTGTLTKGKLSVTSFITGGGRLLEGEQLKKINGLYTPVLTNCLYNNGSSISAKQFKRHAIGGNATDRALLEYVMDDTRRAPGFVKGHVIPFSSADKFALTEVTGGKHLILVKGAPEVLLPKCVYTYNESGALIPFTHSSSLKSMLAAQARDSVRLLALCERDWDGGGEELKNLTLVGFLGIRDEIRKEARTAVSEVIGAGVQVVMVTGDNRDTAVSIAQKLGLCGAEAYSISDGYDQGVLTSQQLSAMSDEEVKRVLLELRVIARALPSDKSRLVRLAQELGLVAGMTGDGVNDAPALKKADVGFAMGDGTEIAKEAGDIVILDNNFASIVKAVLYGRTTFKSIRKFLIFQLTINLCAVGVSVIGPFIGVSTPVTVIQMLWINMIMDTLAGLAYAGETPLPEYMREAPKKRAEPIINRYMYNQILTTGAYTTGLCLLFFKAPFVNTFFQGKEMGLFTAFFALFIFAGVFNSLNARTHRLNLLSYISKNKMFIAVMLVIVVIQVLLIYYGGPVFRTAGLRLNELGLVVAMAFTVIFFDLGRKLLLRANNRKGFI